MHIRCNAGARRVQHAVAHRAMSSLYILQSMRWSHASTCDSEICVKKHVQARCKCSPDSASNTRLQFGFQMQDCWELARACKADGPSPASQLHSIEEGGDEDISASALTDERA